MPVPALNFLSAIHHPLSSAKKPFIAAPDEPTPPGAVRPTGLDLYARFAFAGAVCCSITHSALTPVDVVRFTVFSLFRFGLEEDFVFFITSIPI